MVSLRPYQETAADFLYEHDRAMILAPVGAGKTAITLTAMWEMIRDGHVKRWLVLLTCGQSSALSGATA